MTRTTWLLLGLPKGAIFGVNHVTRPLDDDASVARNRPVLVQHLHFSIGQFGQDRKIKGSSSQGERFHLAWHYRGQPTFVHFVPIVFYAEGDVCSLVSGRNVDARGISSILADV